MPVFRYISKSLLTASFIICTATAVVKAQNCPPNIDFESGSFNGWTCYTGTVYSNGASNSISFNYSGGPVGNRHTIYSANQGAGQDPYGDFPISCPNGSGYSIKLGNDQSGTESEGVSYDFTIPANANIYNLIYNYAVVFQDPSHLPSEQPRMEIEIMNISDNTTIHCSSFTFFAGGSPLPGFELSQNPGSNTAVWFKRWTAVSINLDGLAGKAIRLFFKTADCTFRRHFGYAYIDVNTECSDRFVGADFCPDDTAVNVTAPYGYQSYTWYNSTFTQVLGNQQTLTFAPPPAAGTSVAVVLVPYNGYGCLDTLYTDLTDTLNLIANAGPNQSSCNHNLVQLGVPPKPGWIYEWSPATGLSNANIANPLANPSSTTTYALSMRHNGGGCRSTDTVLVKAAILDNTLTVEGSAAWCIGSGDSTVLKVPPAADSVQWFRNNIAIIGATQPVYKVTQTGVYRALVFNFAGCILPTVAQEVDISSIPVAGFTVNKNTQCFLNNRFTFTNYSTNAVGNMYYKWIFGDGFTAVTRDVSYSYKAAGTYKVMLIVNSNSICADTTEFTITVHPNVFSSFTIDPICVDLPVLPVNNTIEPGNTPVYYLWDFGNGTTTTLRNPPPQVYTIAGDYVMSLSVSSGQCPFPLNIQKRFVHVSAPKPAINNPVEIAVANLPLNLNARPLGGNVVWTPPTSLDNPTSFTPVFLGNKEQLYTIEIKTISGCITVDTQIVKINKSIEIYVPNSFTPNNNSRNDYLKPFMIGIKELNYFRIFNRWGELMFDTRDIKTGWDGNYKGRPVGTQTVVWMLEGIGVDNKVYKTKGSSVLIR
ncbi:MAG TPA: PKD domain-containing protein [Ferruginibacter sp.]|nr:PKD domain-containing protein [Ferruginibacter sp.]